MRAGKRLQYGIMTAAAAGLGFWAAAPRVYGSGFLLKILGLLCFLAAYCAALFLPYSRPRTQKLVRALKRLTALGLALGLAAFAAVQGLIISGWPRGEAAEADCLIVLGAGLNGESLSYVLYTRVRLAADYLLKYPDCVAIVSGGQGPGEDIPEALAMQRYLVGRGISPERIILEDRSSSTEENLRFSKMELDEQGLSGARLAVLSNSFHIFRATWLAGRLGLQVQALGADLPPLPAIILNSYVREFFSVVWMYGRAVAGLT